MARGHSLLETHAENVEDSRGVGGTSRMGETERGGGQARVFEGVACGVLVSGADVCKGGMA